MEIEKRVRLVEDAILLMKDLLINHNGRLDDYYKAIRESREDFEFKMNALIDAQIKNESEISELKESTTELRKSTRELKDASSELKDASRELKDASRSQLTRIEKLETA